MKPNSPLHLIAFLIAFATTSLFALGGCASTSGRTGKAKQALVCPQCKMVEIPDDDYPIKYTVYRDTCPKCQGAITTLFKEGKLKHKCSVCAASPFTCPLYHRD